MGVVNQLPISGVTEDGSLAGFAPTLAKEILHSLGVDTIKPLVGQYGDMVPGLQAGRWDLVTATLIITPERCKQVLYSDPLNVDYVRFASNGKIDLKSFKDLASSGKKVGILTGSVYIQTAKDAGVKADQILEYSDVRAGLDAVMAGRVVAFAGSSSGFNIDNIPSAIVLSDKLTDVPVSVGAFTFAKTSVVLRDAFNSELEKMAKSGEYQSIMKKWEYTDPNEWAFTADGQLRYTAEQGCNGEL
jgi:polar amino acid transport system substrate-binding protein